VRDRLLHQVSTAQGHQAGPTAGLVTGYRPWLDGVRAVAIAMVVVQHTLGRISVDLGFVGVGLFFGLSGYLITSLLLDERAVRGSVSLSNFYLRRAARLFPALVIVVVVCNTLFLIENDYGPLKGSLSVLTYSANYAQVVSPGFVPGYGPTWSLAVEEHFYLLWPLMLLGVTRRYGLQTALRATLAVCLAALAWRTALAAMYAPYDLLGTGSLERADALLYGCAAAIALRLGWRPREWMVWAGIGLVAAMPFVFNHESYTVLVLGNAALGIGSTAVVVGLDYAAPQWLRGCLSVPVVVTVGILSYGIYLWHGPLIRLAGEFGYSGRNWAAVAILVSVLAAGASYRYAEAPIRAWARRRSDRPALHPQPVPLPVTHRGG
jgi:peptidoglycan/LPS O-acetylase OafA/YrhL